MPLILPLPETNYPLVETASSVTPCLSIDEISPLEHLDMSTDVSTDVSTDDEGDWCDWLRDEGVEGSDDLIIEDGASCKETSKFLQLFERLRAGAANATNGQHRRSGAGTTLRLPLMLPMPETNYPLVETASSVTPCLSIDDVSPIEHIDVSTDVSIDDEGDWCDWLRDTGFEVSDDVIIEDGASRSETSKFLHEGMPVDYDTMVPSDLFERLLAVAANATNGQHRRSGPKGLVLSR